MSNRNDSNSINMNPGFIRIKLLELDPPPTKILSLDPFCAVNIKELISSSKPDNLNCKFKILLFF